MAFIEHDNRKKAKKLAEYITGEPLRKYLANIVKKYVEKPVIFDGAVGSGQLEQFIDLTKIIGVDIQEESIEAFKLNYGEKATATVQDFFTYDYEGEQVDAIVMNPPFSLKFKDMTEEAQEKIKKQFPWKKSGVVDDIFVLKSLEYTKRYGFYIAFPGISYRKTEQKFRDEIGTKLKEIHYIQNAFTDTGINVLLLVIDKEKTDKTAKQYLYDAKDDKLIIDAEIKLEKGEQWEEPTIEEEEEQIDIDELNKQIREVNSSINKIRAEMQKSLIEFGFITKEEILKEKNEEKEELEQIIKEIQEML